MIEPINTHGPVTTEEMSKSVDELVKMGCEFVVEGELFKTVIDLIEKLLMDGSPDSSGQAWLLQCRMALLTTSKPVKVKARDSGLILPGT